MKRIYDFDSMVVIPQFLADEIETAVDSYLYISVSDGMTEPTIDEICDYILNKDPYISATLIRLINHNPDIVEKYIRDYYDKVESDSK